MPGQKVITSMAVKQGGSGIYEMDLSMVEEAVPNRYSSASVA